MPYPKKNETEKDYIKRCLSDSEMKSKHPEFNERFAVCKAFFVEYEVNFESYNDYPKQASENAKIALRWAGEHGWGGDAGIEWAQRKLKQIRK